MNAISKAEKCTARREKLGAEIRLQRKHWKYSRCETKHASIFCCCYFANFFFRFVFLASTFLAPFCYHFRFCVHIYFITSTFFPFFFGSFGLFVCACSIFCTVHRERARHKFYIKFILSMWLAPYVCVLCTFCTMYMEKARVLCACVLNGKKKPNI